MEMKPGSRWRSAVCEAEVVVVRPPDQAGGLECGGHPMIPAESQPDAGLEVDPDHEGGVEIGKRYVEPEAGIEVLGVKAGGGSLAFSGVPLQIKDAKPLPSSD